MKKKKKKSFKKKTKRSQKLPARKFKNKRIVVKDIGRNEKGDITINGRPLLKYRIIKNTEKK